MSKEQFKEILETEWDYVDLKFVGNSIRIRSRTIIRKEENFTKCYSIVAG